MKHGLPLKRCFWKRLFQMFLVRRLSFLPELSGSVPAPAHYEIPDIPGKIHLYGLLTEQKLPDSFCQDGRYRTGGGESWCRLESCIQAPVIIGKKDITGSSEIHSIEITGHFLNMFKFRKINLLLAFKVKIQLLTVIQLLSRR